MSSKPVINQILNGKDADVNGQRTKYDNEIGSEGNYEYNYETSNGISAIENGIGGQYASGGYAYYTPERELLQVSYTADRNGFQLVGKHLPTPPPIPRAILKSLKYIRTHPNVEYQI
ncbi:pupal cuticle protein Edg-78E-like [Musca vetustissima]|uniref:pupal cuticle protein Edg-78E-like n=1 Tax=Musca vetustissima TaxID=27455 RepID=UPI002AB70892|nr:pupal cuticle protein Edg-78E-like [Musca vetustissima]